MLMKKKIACILSGLLTILCACEQNEQFSEPQKVESRIYFKNTNDFLSTFNDLSQRSYKEQIEWSKRHCPTPLLSNIDDCKDIEMINMPTSFQALFDKKLEIQINDSILKYANGKLHLITNGEELLCGSASAISASSLEQATTRTITDVAFGKLGMNHQNGCTPLNYKDYYNFKYVHELKSTHIKVNNQNAEALFMTLKLEYKGSSWHEAGEGRTINLNLSGDATVSFFNKGNINVNRSISVERNYDYLLLPAFIITGDIPTRIWNINITGSITHTMNGFPETKWIDTW